MARVVSRSIGIWPASHRYRPPGSFGSRAWPRRTHPLLSSVLLGKALLISALAAGMLSFAGSAPDRRVVDRAQAGDAQSEAAHGYAGYEATSGVAHGRAYRQANGWMRYALSIFEDTEVTLAITFVATDSMPRSYDVVVEDSLIATRTFAPKSMGPVTVEQLVPFVLTRGKASIAITLRGRRGPTPALHELRTVQDHNEENIPGVVK